MKNSVLKVSAIATLAALMAYNIQFFESTDEAGISLAYLENMAYAQNSEVCTPYDYDNTLLKLVTCVLVWQQKLKCSQPAPGKCCKADSQRPCSGSGWPGFPV